MERARHGKGTEGKRKEEVEREKRGGAMLGELTTLPRPSSWIWGGE